MAEAVNLKNRIHGADIFASSQLLNINEDEIIDFSSNINIYSPDIDYKKILDGIKSNINKYPDIKYEKLRHNLSRIYKIDGKYIVPGNGATELIYLIMKLPDIMNVGIFNPTFCEYDRAATIAKKNVFNLTFDLLETGNERKLVTSIEKLDLIVICNPNNPTGEIKDITRLAELSKKYNSLLFVDETFIDFTDNTPKSMLSNIENDSNLIVLKAITKFYAMPGARLGYVFSSSLDIVNKMWDYKEPWTVNSMAQELVKQIEPLDITNLTQSYYKSEIIRLKGLYKDLNIIVSDSVTNYLLLKLPNGNKGVDLKLELLKKYNLLIRTCNDFIGLDDSYVRISIKTQKQNTFLYEAIKMEVR